MDSRLFTSTSFYIEWRGKEIHKRSRLGWDYSVADLGGIVHFSIVFAIMPYKLLKLGAMFLKK